MVLKSWERFGKENGLWSNKGLGRKKGWDLKMFGIGKVWGWKKGWIEKNLAIEKGVGTELLKGRILGSRILDIFEGNSGHFEILMNFPKSLSCPCKLTQSDLFMA